MIGIGRRRWWYAALLTLLAVVGLVLVASWVVVAIYGPAFTRERVEALLSEALEQPVRVGAVHLSPWRGRASLADLEVGTRPTAPGGLGLRAAAIDVSIDIASLWRRRLTVSGLVTDLHLDATVPAGDGGGVDLFPLPQSFAVGPLHIGIGSVRVKGGAVVIRMPETALTVEIVGADVTARPAAGDLDVSGRLDTLQLDTLGRREQLDRVTLDGRLAADLIRIRQVGARWQGAALQLDGEVRHPWVDRREVSLRLRGDIALAALAKAAGSDQHIDGTAQVAIAGQWADRTLRLDDVQVRLGAGRLRGRLEAAPHAGGGTSLSLDLPEIVLPGSLAGLGTGTVTAEGRVRDGGLDLARARAAWRGLTVSLAGRVASGPPLALHATLAADLTELSRALSLGALGGQASVSADLSGRGQTPAIEGRAEIVDLVAAGQAVEPVQASFRLAAAPGPETRWEGTVQVPRLRSGQLAVEQVTAALAVDNQRLTLTRARARAAAAPIEATGAWEWGGAGRGHAEIGPVALGALAGVPPALHLAGTGRATVDASVGADGASASARATLDQVRAGGVSLGAGQVEARLRGPALDAALSFPARRLRARATGRLESGGALATTLALDELALPPLLRELGSAAADHVEGRVSARGEASIPVSQPTSGRGVMRLTPQDLRLLGEPWASRGPLVLRWDGPRVVVEHFQLDGPAGRLAATGTLVGPERRGLSLALDNAQLPGALAQIGRGSARADVRLDGADVELTRLDAHWPGLVVAASGHTGDDGALALTGRVEADLARLAPALGVSGLGGHGTLTVDAHGRPDAIEASGVMRAPRIEVRGATVSDVELPLRWARSSLRLEQGQARIGTSRITADASATWTGRGPMTADALARETQLRAEIRAPAARLEDLSPLLPSAVQGRGELALAARAEGTPRAWRGTGTLTSPLVELGPGPLRQLRAVLALDGTRIDVTELSVDALGVPTRATATWAWAGGGSAKATLGPAPLAGLAGPGVRGTGRATIDAAMSPTSELTGTARAVLDGVVVGDVTLGRGQLDVSARDGAVRADLAFADAGLRASGRGRIDAAGTLDADATVPDVDLARLTRALGPTLSTLGGTVSARATARVPLAEPRRGEGVVSLAPVRLVIAGDAWESAAPIQVRWAQGAFTLAEFRVASKKSGFVTGAGTVGADGKLDGRASGQVRLATLGAIRPEIQEIGGDLDLSLRASGTLAAPVFGGDGAVHHGSLLLRDRPETVRDIEARFTLSSQGVQVRETTAAVGGGRVQARGDLALQGWQLGGYRFKVQAQDVAIGQIEGFSSAWDADLELSGITREAQVTGRARLVRGTYRRELSVLSLLLSPTQATAADTGTPLRLQVRVDLDDNLAVRSRTADLRAGGVITVEGTTARPVIFGAVESRDGRITFRGRDWSVTSATVRFADPRRLDPFIDVVATSRIAEYDVTMQVTGPVSSITVRFSSTPRLSQNDLLSLVAFGVTGAALRESPATVLLGEAGKMLAQNVLGVDPGASGLRISTGSSSDSASEMHGFPGEERNPVGPSRTTPGARKDTVHVEYQLWAPLYLSGEYDREYGYGADVVLRFRFRGGP